MRADWLEGVWGVVFDARAGERLCRTVIHPGAGQMLVAAQVLHVGQGWCDATASECTAILEALQDPAMGLLEDPGDWGFEPVLEFPAWATAQQPLAVRAA